MQGHGRNRLASLIDATGLLQIYDMSPTRPMFNSLIGGRMTVQTRGPANGQVQFSKRRTKCPECGARRGFSATIYVDGESINDDSRGYCHACGHSSVRKGYTAYQDARRLPTTRYIETAEQSAIVPNDVLARTLVSTSPLHRFLAGIDGEALSNHLRQWSVGTDADNYTTYAYYNKRGECQTIKGMLYDGRGHRNKAANARFGVKIDSYYKALDAKSGHRPCLYGEQYLANGARLIDYQGGQVITYTNDTTVMLVESEKSAVLGSYHLPQYVWIATGGTSGIGNKASTLRGRKVMVLFDVDEPGIRAATMAAKAIEDAGGRALATDANGVSIQERVFGRQVPDGYDVADHVVELIRSRPLPEYTEMYERECIRWANEIDTAASILNTTTREAA